MWCKPVAPNVVTYWLCELQWIEPLFVDWRGLTALGVRFREIFGRLAGMGAIHAISRINRIVLKRYGAVLLVFETALPAGRHEDTTTFDHEQGPRCPPRPCAGQSGGVPASMDSVCMKRQRIPW